MTRRTASLAFLVLAASLALLWARSGEEDLASPTASPAAVTPAHAAAQVSHPAALARNPLLRAEPTPEQEEKRARLDAMEARAQQNRRKLFATNLARLDDAIERAEAEGSDPEYLDALRLRRSLLEEQREEEAVADAR